MHSSILRVRRGNGQSGNYKSLEQPCQPLRLRVKALKEQSQHLLPESNSDQAWRYSSLYYIYHQVTNFVDRLFIFGKSILGRKQTPVMSSLKQVSTKQRNAMDSRQQMLQLTTQPSYWYMTALLSNSHQKRHGSFIIKTRKKRHLGITSSQHVHTFLMYVLQPPLSSSNIKIELSRALQRKCIWLLSASTKMPLTTSPFSPPILSFSQTSTTTWMNPEKSFENTFFIYAVFL
jgi:hypothetical protein